MVAPLARAVDLLTGAAAGDPAGPRDRVLVLVTDGQVGNEDQILRRSPRGSAGCASTPSASTGGQRRLPGRLAALGGGACELVESEDRLDEAMDQIHRRIGAPVLTDLSWSRTGWRSTWSRWHRGACPTCSPGCRSS